MKEKIGKYALLTFVWVIVVGYVVCSATMLHTHKAEQVVRSVEIEVADSSAHGHLVSSRKVREWILHSGISTIGTPVEEVNLTGLEQVITKNGFVSDVNSYVTYDGVLHIEVSQRRPMLRLMIDGYDTYVTESGFVFRSPAASALYVPVVTGSYRPPFPANYEGDVRDHIDKLLKASNDKIVKIEKEKNPLYKLEDSLRLEIKNERRRRTKQGWFEDDESFEARVEKLRAEKHRNIRRLRGALRHTDNLINKITVRSDAEYRVQKKLEKRYEDFLKLINFVRWIEDDQFWSAEIVQIDASTTPSGALELELVPRSGNYTILFGSIENVEQKFDKLMRFYKEGLNNRGWDRYSTINIKYEGQVVCSK